MTERVFAFGSNMCSGRLRDYGVNPVGPGQPALLRGYRLVFDKRSVDGSGKASLQPAGDASVWGVLWEILDADLAILDRGEGRGYSRKTLQVSSILEQTTAAWVYLTVAPEQGLRPYGWYMRFLVEGAIEHALPGKYVAQLRALPFIVDSDGTRDAKKRALQCGE